MKQKSFETLYKDKKIRIESLKINFPPKIVETCYIDGAQVGKNISSVFRQFYTTRFVVAIEGINREIELRMSAKPYSLKSGHQILVDGDFVSGDINLQFPDPKDVDEQFKKGYLNFFLKHGLVRMGIPMGIIVTLLTQPDTFAKIVFTFIFNSAFIGFVFSMMQWRELKRAFGEFK